MEVPMAVGLMWILLAMLAGFVFGIYLIGR